MSIAENKQTVAGFLERLPQGTADWGLVDDGAVWWIQGAGNVSKAQIREIAGGIAAMTSSAEMFMDHVTAEDDRVAVEAHSRIAMTDGRLFENTYHFLFHLKDGKIISAREHFDTGLARDFFGAETQDALIGGGGTPA